MAEYRILELGEPVLRVKAQMVPAVTASIHKLLDNMLDTMRSARGVGLAAPQIGISKRVIVVDAGTGLVELINPEITARTGSSIEEEGCLSIPGVRGTVGRSQRVVVSGWNRHGETMQIEAEDLLARVFQHEIDHLDGILFVDKVIDLIDD